MRVVEDSSPAAGYDGMKRLCLVSADAWEPSDEAKGAVPQPHSQCIVPI